MATKSVQETSWDEAWTRAEESLEGVSRVQVPGSEDVELNLLDWGGSGELIVLHHANGFCAATLAPVAQALRDSFRVVAIDARGHGDSTPVAVGGTPDPYAWETLSADLEAGVRGILKHTGHERIALAIGHSFGGALFLRVASQAPELIDRLLLWDPVLLPPRNEMNEERRSHPNVLADATRKRRDHFPSREAAYLHCRSRGLYKNFAPEALALYVGEGMAETPAGEIALKCDRNVEAAIFEAGAASALPDTLDRVKAEVLFVHAKHGNFPRPYFDDIAARLSRSRVTSVDAGHLFPLEAPEQALSFVREILSPSG